MKEKSLKRELGINFVAVTAAAIILTVLCVTAVFYRAFREETLQSMSSCAHALRDSGVFYDYKSFDFKAEDGIRITLIDTDGTVLYDNFADVSKMSNHASRPEVMAAFEKGEGSAVRQSETLDKATFYDALRLEDGRVLRVAKETGSVFAILKSSLPASLGVMALLTAICAALTIFLTEQIVRPVEDVAEKLGDTEYVHVYKEIRPFIDTINTQHKDIMKAAMMRQEFTANVSHELKTPLTSISGYSELIADGMAKDKDAVHFAGEIHKNADRLLSLINDIIRLSQLDAQEKAVEKKPVNLYGVAEEVKKRLAFEAESHGVIMNLSGTDVQVSADRNMLDELIGNLCDNAVRYNVKGGKVDVKVDIMPEGSGYSASVTVSDTGIGIAPEDQERIFERFYRVDKGRSRASGGTGLGLAIVKHTAQKLDAKIELNSIVGKGTEIRVIFR